MAFSIPASRAWTRPSWRSTLSTNDKTTAEDKLRKLGYEWQWLEQDSAGVTTGPVTVPLVLAMGLGLGNAVSAVEGFGILSLASICPIIAVLSMGIFIQFRRVHASRTTTSGSAELENE